MVEIKLVTFGNYFENKFGKILQNSHPIFLPYKLKKKKKKFYLLGFSMSRNCVLLIHKILIFFSSLKVQCDCGLPKL